MLDKVTQIEEVDESQWARWREVRLRALKEAPTAFGSTYEEWEHAPEWRWRHRLSGDGIDLLAVQDGVPCGMASGIAGQHESTIELISMWVDPKVRGGGVADELIYRIARWAATRATQLRLSVVPTNERAIAVYRRHGFQPVAEVGDPLSDGSGHEMLMVLDLRSPRS